MSNELQTLMAQHERTTMYLMRLVSRLGDLELSERVAVVAAELPTLRARVCSLSDDVHAAIIADATNRVTDADRRIGRIERRQVPERRKAS